jgi:hypothetical protein
MAAPSPRILPRAPDSAILRLAEAMGRQAARAEAEAGRKAGQEEKPDAEL